MTENLYNRFLKVMSVFIIFVIILAFYEPINKVINERKITVTVTDKAVKNNGSEGIYLIFTKDTDGNTQVLEITDSLLKFRFNSSDVYAEIDIGKTYTFTICGSRNRFLSWYPNIYEYKEIK